MNDLRLEAAVLWRHQSLLRVMTRREMSARYAGSALGMAWAFAQPFLTVAAYYLVFDVVFAMRMGAGAPTARVGTYLIVGSLPWLAFCESVSRGAGSLVDAGAVLQKNALPPVLFVARSVLASLLVFAPLLVLLTLAYLPVSGLTWAHATLPVLFVLQALLVFLLAYALAILTAAARDTTQVLGFVLSVGIFVSPVLFPLSLFPQAWRWVLFANPMTAFVLSYQSVLLQGAWPSADYFVIILLWLLALLLLLNHLLRRSRDELVDWL